MTCRGVGTTVVCTSAPSIATTLPNGATTGPISVTTSGGTAISASNFTVIPPPTINSFSPTTAPARTTATITDTNFTGVTSVTINGVAASFTVNSSTSIATTLPNGATTGPISVTTSRSEERRVGKECRSRWSTYH